MPTIHARIVPRSAFGTPLLGDTFFGQLCWAIRNRHTEARLETLLEGYTGGRPFLVVSDAFPSGYVPRPTLPGHVFRPLNQADRKSAKSKKWFPLEKLNEPIVDWLNHCVTSGQLPSGQGVMRSQSHNTINRNTGTTGTGMFAPYGMDQFWYLSQADARSNGSQRETVYLDIYMVLESTRLSIEELSMALSDVGQLGFGRDASIGLGRFDVDSLRETNLPCQAGANAWLTLAPCAPQGMELDPAHSFYQVFIRFGRHADVEVLRGSRSKPHCC